MVLSICQSLRLSKNSLAVDASHQLSKYASLISALERPTRLNLTRCWSAKVSNRKIDSGSKHAVPITPLYNPWVRSSVQLKCFSTSTRAASDQPRTKEAVSGSRTQGEHENISTKSDTPRTHLTSSKFQGRSILITGGTSGIGFAIVKRALLEGASHVRIVTRDSSRGQDAIDRLRTELTFDLNVDIVQAEVHEYGQAKLFSSPSHSPDLLFDTLVHSAGISQTSLLPSTQSSTISQILQVNLESAALLSKQFLKRYMQHLRRGRQNSNTPPTTSEHSQPRIPSWTVTNISSLLASKSGVGSSIYAASKAGLIALTRTIALEGAEIRRKHDSDDGQMIGNLPGFRANVVVPGYIETPMTKNFSNTTRTQLLGQIPAGRFGTPEEIADAVVFLLHNEYANNCVLGLDGGLSGV